ncbi:MAG: carboxypeptidase-like regulatory domain-containing protein [Patiriisocius sp.]|uniref:carboxypeptidase-like regulatory domain-containing protein n=1 Tax=Patiriisocius sp. TaxID=2822396 RepID=UPI003EF802E0
MKKAIHVQIPEPCHEDWAKMTPTQKGRHCASCEKEVTDFTQKSDEQIVKMLTANPNSCGRFKKTQLKREIKLERKSTASLAPYAASLLLPLTLLSSLNTKASSKETKTEKVYKSIGVGRYSEVNNLLKVRTITIGVVTDSHGNVLNKVKITSNETGVVTYTNIKGEYEIKCFHGETLCFEKPDYEPFEFMTTRSKNVKNISLSKIELQIERTTGKIKIAPQETREEIGDVIVEEETKEEIEEKVEEKTDQDNTLKKISGTVTDSSGLPLPGVNIIVKGTTNGTQSDFDGLYSLTVEEGQTLVYSYVGFDTIEKQINEYSNILNVFMEEGGTLGGLMAIGGYWASEPNRVTATRPFGNVSFANDWEREAEKSKQRKAYQNGLKFQYKKLRERREARQLKRQQRKEERAQRKLERQKSK